MYCEAGGGMSESTKFLGPTSRESSNPNLQKIFERVSISVAVGTLLLASLEVWNLELL
jgi:hypothetical protein